MRIPAGALRASLPGACLTAGICLALGPFWAPGAVCSAETRQVLAIRVDFQPDTLETTTGDGRFGSAFQFDSSWAIDRLPHDAAYFLDHLSFLDFYWNKASDGQLRVQGEVWPQHPDSAYHLPKQMWQYNWNMSREKTDEQLIQLFRDAWEVADDDPALDFSRFDSFIVFHAGVGQDFGDDQTPHDIPSAWVSPRDLGQPIACSDGVAGALTLIDNGLLLPESENHENFQQGLAGTMVLQFAHVLGLPNLYNSQDGSSVIGKWGLMDQGSANFRGLVPALPSAFSRTLMGWEQPVVLAHDTTGVLITPAGLDGAHPRVYKVPLSETEHLLLEYRLRDADGDSLVLGQDRAGNVVRMDERYELSFPGDSAGVIVSVNDLDYDLPGSGLLIWHVDERRTTADYVSGNRVNDDPDPLNGYGFPGVDLEEGDGIQDIGQPYGLLDSRRGVELGSSRDSWYSNNRDWRRVNPDLGEVEYSWQSEPSSQTNDGRISGVRIHGFSARDGSEHSDSLQFSLSFDYRPAIHGLALCPPSDSSSVTLLDLDGLASVFCALQPDGMLYSRLLDGALTQYSTANRYESLLPASGSGPFRGIWLGPPTSGDWPALWALRGDVFHRYEVEVSSLPEARYVQVDFHDPFTQVDRVLLVSRSQPLIWYQSGRQLYMGNTETGDRTLIFNDLDPDAPVVRSDDASTELHWISGGLFQDWNAPAGAGLWGLGQAGRILYHDRAGFRIVQDQESQLLVEQPNQGVWPLQAGQDDTLEVLLLDLDGRLRTYNANGAEIAHSPVLESAGARVLPASWLNTGLAAAVTLFSDGRLQRLNPDGAADPDWPRVMAPLVGDLCASPRLGLYLGVRADGRIEAWEGAPDNLLLSSTGGPRVVESLGQPESTPSVAQVENPVYIWPSPAGTRANLRVDSPGAADLVMRVYDLAGDLRQTVTARIGQAGYTDILWDTRGLANGPYLCAVELTPDQGNAVHTLLKCAVLR